MGKKWFVTSLIFTMILAAMLVGCKDDKSTNNDGGNLDSQYVGTWVFQSVTVNGDQASLADVLDWNEGAIVAMLMIESDGGCTYQESDQYGNSVWNSYGTFAVDGDNFTITFTSDSDGNLNPADITTGTVDVSETSMTITYVEGEATVVVTLAQAQSN